MAGAYQTGIYRNVFKECGYEETAITERLNRPLKPYFTERRQNVFIMRQEMIWRIWRIPAIMMYAREGMSYGMMVCVQLDKKAEFDRLWKWVRTYMYIPEGPCRNWLLPGPAARMERTMRRDRRRRRRIFRHGIVFASARWGDGEGIFAYSKEAKAILRECIHKRGAWTSGRTYVEPSII